MGAPRRRRRRAFSRARPSIRGRRRRARPPRRRALAAPRGDLRTLRGGRPETDRAGGRPPAWDAALELVLDRASHVDWWLTGSAALALRGLPVAPRDVDLVTTLSGAWELGERLSDVLVEPLSTSADWVAEVFGRAYGPARIEWVGGVRAWVDEPEPADLGPYAAARLETVEWRGHAIRVPPLVLQLASSSRRGLEDRVAAIQRAL